MISLYHLIFYHPKNQDNPFNNCMIYIDFMVWTLILLVSCYNKFFSFLSLFVFIYWFCKTKMAFWFLKSETERLGKKREAGLRFYISAVLDLALITLAIIYFSLIIISHGFTLLTSGGGDTSIIYGWMLDYQLFVLLIIVASIAIC